jgi:hypothetical protein
MTGQLKCAKLPFCILMQCRQININLIKIGCFGAKISKIAHSKKALAVKVAKFFET